MKKVKKQEKEKEPVKNEVTHYSKFKGRPMVYIKGNFFNGGFAISKNKVKAILDNIEELKRFANGDYDERIMELEQDEILEL